MICTLIAALHICALTSPPDDPHPALEVEEWWGSYDIRIQASASSEGESASIREHVSGEFHLNLKTPGGAMPGREPDINDLVNPERMMRMISWVQLPDEDEGPLPKVQVAISESHRSPTLRREAAGQGTATQVGFVRLFVDGGKKLYGLEIPFGIPTEELTASEVIEHQRVENDRAVWKKQERKEYGARTIQCDAPQIADQRLPDNPAVLSGTVVQPVSIKGHEGNAGTMTVRWFLTSKPVSPVELVVEIEGENGTPYPRWRPRAGMTEDQVGAHLTVRATLRKKGGGEPEVKAKQIELLLTRVSFNPGVCINWPPSPKIPPAPDLKFQPGNGLEVEDDSASRAGPVIAAQAVLTCHDFGASAQLQAVATLEDGRQIIGHLKDEPGTETIPIPKSRGGSRIADSWREYRSADGGDRDDDENEPVGDGTKGDGLTLFEEYRGFLEDELWSDGNPSKKDFFICDRYHGLVPKAVAHFEKISGLEVHGRLKRNELSHERVVNYNSEDGDRLTRQHGIVVEGSMEATDARAHGGPGSPKQISVIEVPSRFDPTRLRMAFDPESKPVTEEYFIMSLCHEFLHACNVWHHGESDTTEWWLIEENPDKSMSRYFAKVDADENLAGKLGPNPFFVYEEDGTVRKAGKPGLYLVPIAEKNGQHSGVEDCVMRYDSVEFYRKSDDDYYYGKERTGTGICDSDIGTGSNDAKHVPMSRHGNAARKRGLCRLQIMVNDAVTAQRR